MLVSATIRTIASPPVPAMKLKSFQTFPVTLPDEDPEWKFAGQAYPKNEAVVVALNLVVLEFLAVQVVAVMVALVLHLLIVTD